MTEHNSSIARAVPAGIRVRTVPGVNGLDMQLLEAGFESPGRPCIVLLHGFPELAYSWRKVMLPLARAGFYVLAPDQRGYGGTTGWDSRYDGDLDSYRMLNLVRDLLALLAVLRINKVDVLAGHDFGSPVAAWAALIRPDVFRSVALMSAPFAGPPALPLPAANVAIHHELAQLPRPRRHYQWYYSRREANAEMLAAPQGLAAFLRAYYHVKSADWSGNQPAPLAGWSAQQMAQLPEYYVMDLNADMPASVAPYMPTQEQIRSNSWLTDDELAVYVSEYSRTGFQGGLQWYRCGTNGKNTADFTLFSGQRIVVPAIYLAGVADWGTFQRPGDYERMPTHGCARLLGSYLIDGAGHWLQQEQPNAVVQRLLELAAWVR